LAIFGLFATRRGSPLAEAIGRSKRAVYSVVLLSAVLNVLLLGGSIFMMAVYDMVLPSGSLPTLFGLLMMIIVVYIFQGFFEVARSRVLADIGATVDLSLTGSVHQAVTRHALYSRNTGDGLQPLRDLEQIRTFLSGGGPTALIDLPWMFFFIGILFLMHVWLGLTALLGALVLTALTMITERMSQKRMLALAHATSKRNALSEAHRRHAQTVQAMGMGTRMRDLWFAACSETLDSQQRLADIAGTMGATSKMLRIFLQSAMLAMGAWIVISGQATGGIIFASAILSSRALAPVEQAIANWRGFLAARQGWARLDEFLSKYPSVSADRIKLLAPVKSFSVEGLTLVPPGGNKPTVARVQFAISAGDAVGVIGSSGSGKTSLMRGLLGIWPAVEGTVRLDGAAIDQWAREDLGVHIGYLPQNVELLDGSIAQNIARFEPGAPSEMIIAAAMAAGVHDMILKLPSGYETAVDADGAALSAGQRQRVALARALYRDPFLLVLDEPNSNLDTEGEEALAVAIRNVRERGGAVIIVAHRPSILSEVNLVLLMRDGQAQAFGPRDEILSKMIRSPAGASAPTVARPIGVPSTGLVRSSIVRPVGK
jgi:PrtD family type I secretion system ABC transporter